MFKKIESKPKKILIDDGNGPGGNPREVNVYEDHPIPVTRRDFIRMGLLSPAATLFVASPLMLLLQKQAKAASSECVLSYNRPTKLFELDLAGGFPLIYWLPVGIPPTRPLNPGEKVGDYLRAHWLPQGSYAFHGWDPYAAGAVRTDVFGEGDKGFPMNSASTLTQSILRFASPEARRKTSMGVIVKEGFADIDSGNPYSCAAMIAAADGDPHLGTMPTQTGSRKPSVGTFPTSAIPILSSTSFSSLYSLGSSSITSKILDASINFNELERSRMSAKKGGEKLVDILQCSDEAAKMRVATAASLDPTSSAADPRYKEIFKLGEPEMREHKLIASTMALGLFSDLANTGSGCVSDCDIHDKTEGRIMEKDKGSQIGMWVGGMIEAAHRAGKKLAIMMSTDGNAVTLGGNPNGAGPWDGDSSLELGVVILYDPAGAPDIKWPQQNGMKNRLEAAAHFANFAPQRAGWWMAANGIYFRDGNLNGFPKYYTSPDGTDIESMLVQRRS